MSVETFLQLAEQGGFLNAKTVNKLRNNLASSSKPVTVDELAALLVRRDVLSSEQSASLLQATHAAAGAELTLENDFNLRPARRESDTHKSLDLLDVDPDENVTLLSAEPVPKPTGLMQDGPQATDGRSQADPAPVPNLTPMGDEYRMVADSGFESLLDDDLEVDRPTGVIAALRELFRRNSYKGQRWDSSLMMIGGGMLLLLILAGGALYFVLTVGSGDEYFQLAEDDYKAQRYAQSIQKYDRFINRFPRHNKVSLAKVRVGLAHMRSDVEAGNWDAALRSAQTRLDQIRSEDEFPAARSELAGILPAVYAGFVDLAEAARTPDAKEAHLAQAAATFELIDDPDYLPSSQRRQIQSRIDRIDGRIEKVRRDIDRQREVASTVAKIEQAVADGDSAAAYQFRDALLERYPGAQKNQRFQDAVMKITGAEQRSVKVSDEAITAATDARPTPPLQKVALSARRAGDATALDEHVLYTLARGGLYAIDGRTGKVLWRRWLGFQSYTPPVTLDDGPGADVVAIDHRHGDLMRLAATTGQLQWRADVGPAPCAPVVWDQNLIQVNNDGKLFWIDAADGRIQKTATFPQALTAPPGVDRQDHLLFQPGNHSTLYVLDADSFDCVQTVFIGHSDGMITVAPTVTKDHVFVIENGATDYCRLHVLARSRQGKLKKAGKPLRLSGIVVSPPITYGRSMLIATDRGAVYVLESDAANVQEPVRVFAQVHPRNQRTSDHFGLLSGDRILISGTGLSEYEINSARGELALKWTEHLDDVHVAAPQLVGETLITRRRSPAAGDVIVEAAKIPAASASNEAPRPIWTTRIAAPPAGPPHVNLAQRKFLVTARNGSTWPVDTAAFRGGLMEQALDESPSPLTAVIPIGPSGVAFAAADGRPTWQYAAGDGTQTKTVALGAVQNRLSTAPVRFAEGLLVCTTTGPIHYVAADSGKLLADSFQLPLSRGARIRWLRPAVDGSVAWVASEDGLLQRLELMAEGLRATKSADLKTELTRNSAVAGSAVYLVARTRMGDAVVAVARDTLEVIEKFPIDSRITAGPTTVGDRVMIATADDRWMAFGNAADGAPKPQRHWARTLPLGTLAGAPLVHDGTWICTTQAGDVFRSDAATGTVLPWSTGEMGDLSSIALGEPLGSGAVIYNRLLLVSGSEGTLYATPLPEAVQ